MLIAARVVLSSNDNVRSQPPGAKEVVELPDSRAGAVLLHKLAAQLIRSWKLQNPDGACQVCAEVHVDPAANGLSRRLVHIQFHSGGRWSAVAKFRATTPNGRLSMVKGRGFPFETTAEALGMASNLSAELESYVGGN
jgi:hypothetical protein